MEELPEIPSSFDNLSNEDLTIIFGKVFDFHSLLTARGVNHRWKEIITNNIKREEFLRLYERVGKILENPEECKNLSAYFDLIKKDPEFQNFLIKHRVKYKLNEFLNAKNMMAFIICNMFIDLGAIYFLFRTNIFEPKDSNDFLSIGIKVVVVLAIGLAALAIPLILYFKYTDWRMKEDLAVIIRNDSDNEKKSTSIDISINISSLDNEAEKLLSPPSSLSLAHLVNQHSSIRSRIIEEGPGPAPDRPRYALRKTGPDLA